jgi:hypothetical protein
MITARGKKVIEASEKWYSNGNRDLKREAAEWQDINDRVTSNGERLLTEHWSLMITSTNASIDIVSQNLINLYNNNNFRLGVSSNLQLPSLLSMLPMQQGLMWNILDKFKLDNPLFKKEDVFKFIIGEKEAIKAAETYEKQNDDYVQDLIDNQENISEHNMEFDDTAQNSTSASSGNSSSTRRSIPVQYKIEDSENENVVGMVEIMKKESRDEDNKSDFMDCLKKAIEEDAIVFVDHNSTPINLELYTLKEFRCFRNGNSVDSYRFKNYKAHFQQKEPYKNGDIKKNECEIHCCINQYKLIIANEPKPFINNSNTFYMTFAY